VCRGSVWRRVLLVPNTPGGEYSGGGTNMYNSYFGFHETPFNVTPDPDFLWTNATYIEAFATLQYGIEAKKGFIVITGEVGTGKTTLLRKLMRRMGSSTHSVFIFNTYLTFNELLRLTLRDLGLSISAEDRISMIEQLNDYLIEQLSAGNVVCLLIDEAQNLSDEALEGIRLLSNLETDKEKLLQIVLMGQPELKERLDRPQLRQLKQRVVLECELAPLKPGEVRSYIDFRLQAGGYEGPALFGADAIARIAFYSRGIPRLINVLCDNALLNAYAGSQKIVTPPMVEEAARDLRLGKHAHAGTELPGASSAPAERETAALRDRDETADAAWEAGEIEIEPPVRHRHRRRRYGRIFARAGLAVLLILIALAAAGAVFYPKDAESYLAYLKTSVEELIGVREENGGPATAGSTRRAAEIAPAAEIKPADESEAAPPEESSARPKVETAARDVTKRPENQDRSRAFNDREGRRKKLELQVAKAIQNRAIEGVQVSVVNGTAFLDGSVGTERQKSAAEEATRGVPDVKQVQNRIVVNSILDPESETQ
jgi:general secretion pathway protein A